MDLELAPKNNLYEIPNCSICLNEMTEDLASLACGHIFHIDCITQHFEYKGTCPYCQKRAQIREIRLVIYPVAKNSETEYYLKTLLSNISTSSEGQQIEKMLHEIKCFSENSSKLNHDLQDVRKELTKRNEEYGTLKKEHEEKSTEASVLKRENLSYVKRIAENEISYERLNIDYNELRSNYDEIVAQRKEMELYKTLQKVASDNSEELQEYKKELESSQTPSDVIAKRFFDMLQLKNLTVLKLKEIQKEYAEKYQIKEEENLKAKSRIQTLKKELEANTTEIAKWKSKVEMLKKKCRELTENLKSKCPENAQGEEDMEQNSLSISLGLTNKICTKSQTLMQSESKEKNERQLNFNIVEKPKIPQSKLSFGSALKKSAGLGLDKKQMTLNNFIM